MLFKNKYDNLTWFALSWKITGFPKKCSMFFKFSISADFPLNFILLISHFILTQYCNWFPEDYIKELVYIEGSGVVSSVSRWDLEHSWAWKCWNDNNLQRKSKQLKQCSGLHLHILTINFSLQCLIISSNFMKSAKRCEIKHGWSM